ncbi:glycosyltransferase [Larkinella knui]
MIQGFSQHAVINEVVSLDDPQAAYLRDTPFMIHAVGPAKSAWQYAPEFLPWLKKYLQNYDAVIVHGLWHYHTYGIYKVWSQLKADKPALYVMPHGMLDPWFQRAAGRKLKAARNWLFWKLVEHKLINSATGLLFTCETEKIMARKPFRPYSPKTENVVGLGVEYPPVFTLEMQETFLETCRGLTGKFLLFISRIDPKKGVDLVIKAYRALKLSGVDLPQLVIAGPGLNTAFGQEMVKLAGDDKAILFPGMLSGNAKWGAFYTCEAFVLPSHQENFGIAVVEALACFKPVLISDQVNIWREIDNGDAGLIGEDTEEGVYNLLDRWIKMPAGQKKQMELSARRVFDTHFTVSQASKNMLRVLNQNVPVIN